MKPQTEDIHDVAPLLAAGVRPLVEAGSPHIEGVVVRNNKTDRYAVFLMDWSCFKRDKLYIDIRGVGNFTQVRSAALDLELSWSPSTKGVRVVLPKIDDGDILLFE